MNQASWGGNLRGKDEYGIFMKRAALGIGQIAHWGAKIQRRDCSAKSSSLFHTVVFVDGYLWSRRRHQTRWCSQIHRIVRYDMFMNLSAFRTGPIADRGAKIYQSDCNITISLFCIVFLIERYETLFATSESDAPEGSHSGESRIWCFCLVFCP